MVTDQQVKKLFKLFHSEANLADAASKAGMSETTARKYIQRRKLPSECRVMRTWKTRHDPFEDVWDSILAQLELNPGLEAITIFKWLQRKYPGKYGDGQIRTLQRKLRDVRSLYTNMEEWVISDYAPGHVCSCGFLNMNDLNISLEKKTFNHFIFHFLMPYSQWQTGTILREKSFESFSIGLQNALWELGGVPNTLYYPHNIFENGFKAHYQALLKYYGLVNAAPETYSEGNALNIQEEHYYFRNIIEQSLVLMDRKSFADLKEYKFFLRKLFGQLNVLQKGRLKEELKVLRALPGKRFLRI
ncbi:MAG: hypothetical protein ACMUIP_18140 [bacterium]